MCDTCLYLFLHMRNPFLDVKLRFKVIWVNKIQFKAIFNIYRAYIRNITMYTTYSLTIGILLKGLSTN